MFRWISPAHCADRIARGRSRALLGGVLVSLLALGGCGFQSDSTSASTVDPNAPPALAAGMTEGRWVQDLWLYERMSTFAPDGTRVELLDEILANLPGQAEEPVRLPHDAEFIVYPELRPWLSRGDGARRDDVDVVAGILRTSDGDGFAVVATPRSDAAGPIGLEDSVELDLTFLGDKLSPEDPISIDFAFLQALPGADPTDAGALEVLAHRMAENRVRYYGAEIDGEAIPLAYEGMSGAAVKGSTRSRTPAKADPMMEGFRKGLRGCRGGLRCVRNYFKSFGGGASKSNDLINCNLGGSCFDPPPPPPQPPRCLVRCGGVRGDPHLTTFDGARLSMQAVGEFVAVSAPKLEVQFRTAPLRNSRKVSVVTAMAIDVDGVRILLDAGDGSLRARVDGKLVQLARNGEELAFATGTLSQFHRAVHIATASGHRIIVSSASGRAMDFVIELGEGSEASGMLGNNDGNPADDHRSRDGKVLDQPLTGDQLYKVFAAQWRLNADESMFVYGSGESITSFTDLTFPDEQVTLQSLPADVRARAEAVCREAGIALQPILDECIFDFASSGDMAFVWAAQRNAMLAGATAGMTSVDVDASSDDGSTPAAPDPNAEATLTVPDTAAAGSTMRVSWAGPNEPYDYISVAKPDAHGRENENYTRTDAGDPLHLLMPVDAGTWEVRYVQSDGHKVLARQSIVTTAVEASVRLPKSAPAGSTVEVTWTGPDYPYDYIAVSKPGARGRDSENYTRTEVGNPLSLLLPNTADIWEVRYVQSQGRKVLASRTIETTALEATLKLPERAPAGSMVEVAWTGPDYAYDYISVAKPGAAGRENENYTRTETGSPLKLLMPAIPGAYEVRYVQSQGHKVLVSQTIRTTPLRSSLEVPASAAAGSTIKVNWTGPDYPYDYISVVKPGAPGRENVNYTRTEAGKSLDLLLPAEAGTWEVRYVQSQGHTVLARKVIRSTPVAASLDIPSSAPAGSTIKVDWAGPNYPHDYISVAKPDAVGRSHDGYTRTEGGSPLNLRLPSEPGTYEVRYVQSQSHKVLASKPLKIVPASP